MQTYNTKHDTSTHPPTTHNHGHKKHLQGAGSTTVMITSHSMANDLVGEHAAAKGGFVYGAFSLTDKCVGHVL